eukprot:2245966-Pyramimonas_sp.AAC.1
MQDITESTSARERTIWAASTYNKARIPHWGYLSRLIIGLRYSSLGVGLVDNLNCALLGR